MDPTNREITKIARELNKLTLRTMKAEGLGSSEFDYIHYVRHHPGCTAQQLCMELQMDKGAAARRAAALESKGYLIRKENPQDKRSQLLFATAEAEDLKDTRTRIETVFYEWLLEDLEPAEAEAFCHTLEHLYHRSKTESRSGFPHIAERLKGEPEDE